MFGNESYAFHSCTSHKKQSLVLRQSITNLHHADLTIGWYTVRVDAKDATSVGFMRKKTALCSA